MHAIVDSAARGRVWLSAVAEVEGWMRGRRSRGSRPVDRAGVKCNLGRFYQSYLFEGVVEYFELLHGQIPIDFDDYPFHSDTGCWISGRIDQE